MKEVIQKAREKMLTRIENLRHDLAKIRIGRAHPEFLSHLNVDYYGTPTPISQIANISILDTRTLIITPWENGILTKIEKAILISNLGLNPTNLGNSLRVPMPDLNEDRRKEMIKIVRLESEKSRVSVRIIRRDSNSEIKNLLKQKNISEDIAKKMEVNIQKLTKEIITKIDILNEKKEKDLMAI